MKNFKDVAHTYQDALSPLYPTTEIKQFFLMAYTFVTGEGSTHYMLNSTDEVGAPELGQFLGILEELQTGRPIQHILGVADFYGMRLSVNEHTLIPRPETEELVEWVVSEHQEREQLSILDIGTGSGCIALALKKQLPHARVDALDLDAEAVTIARKNATNLDLSVHFIQGDILEWDSFIQDAQQYDVIVSNPPYITPDEREAMHQNVLLFEPHQALFVEKHAPLLFYDVIAEMGKKHLLTEGNLYFEINQYLSRETRDLLNKKGYGQVTLRQDINKADRMIKAGF